MVNGCSKIDLLPVLGLGVVDSQRCQESLRTGLSFFFKNVTTVEDEEW